MYQNTWLTKAGRDVDINIHRNENANTIPVKGSESYTNETQT